MVDIPTEAWIEREARAHRHRAITYRRVNVEEVPTRYDIWSDIRGELTRAEKWPGFNSAHEGYAILAEEVDELWAHVKVNQKKRDLDAMRAEAIQVAAMAVKFVQMIDAGRGRV